MEENPLTRELTKEELAEFRSAFDMFDIDGGGTFCFYPLDHVVSYASIEMDRSFFFENDH